MNCRKIEQHLQEDPGAPLPRELQEHLSECRDCARLWREQKALAGILKAFPQAELPAYLEARLISRLEGRRGASNKRMLEPGWLTLAAPAMALIIAFSALVMRYAPPDIGTPASPISARNQQDPASVQPSGQARQSGPSQIYPVWPTDEDVVAREDLTIMASLYPDHSGKVKILLDDRDVSAGSTIGRQYISYDPQALEAGEHVVKVILQQADGSSQTASWSFYLLEERS